MHLTLKGDSLSVSSSDIPEEKLNEIKDAVDEPLDLSRAFGGYAQAIAQINICFRIIDYRNRTGKTEACTIGIENFYDVKSEVTIIKQFLYKVNRVKDNYEDMVQYAVKLPVSESDKKEYMDEGWKIHPMFYNKENGCYMPSVRIKRPMQMMECDKDNSITLPIISGLQMLHLVEYGLNEKDKEEPGRFAGIDYTNNGIIISNSYTDENNRLVIDGEETVLIKDMAGYISKFLYWNNKFDWLFFPKETVRNVYMSISDSEFVGPSMGVNNIIKWGNIDSDNFGIFNYWMHSTEASENDYIIPWEFSDQ